MSSLYRQYYEYTCTTTAELVAHLLLFSATKNDAPLNTCMPTFQHYTFTLSSTKQEQGPHIEAG